MAHPIHKLNVVTDGGTLELAVTKSGGPVVTRAVVGSTGDDDRDFSDSELTQGTASMPLQPANTYSIVWTGAFVGAGRAVRRVRATTPQGGQFQTEVTVDGNAGDSFFRVVLVP